MQASATTTSEIHDVALRLLRSQLQRYTANRRAIVQALHEAEAPLTIARLLDRSPGLAQSSAYRNLGVLEEAGVVHRIVTADDHARFELTERLTGTHHHHLVCASCGDVFDVALSDRLEQLLHDELEERAAGHDFTADYHRIDLIGRCAACV